MPGSYVPLTTIHHPGDMLLSGWTLELFRESRQQEDNLIFAIDSFTLPRRSSRSFEVIQAPGAPPFTFPGPVSGWNMQIEVTNFYQRDLWQFLVQWYEAALVDVFGNMYNGYVIGYDDEKIIRYKADLYHVYCAEVDFGAYQRNINRHTILSTLVMYDVIHDLEFEKFTFRESEPTKGIIL